MTTGETIGFGLGVVEALMMAAIVVLGAVRWSRLDAGAKWIIAGLVVYVIFAFIMAPMVLLGRTTRLIQEIPFLLAALCQLIGLAKWQPGPIERRISFAAVPLYLLLWTLAQVLQDAALAFSAISGPIYGAVLIASAGYTMTVRIQATPGRWTENVWFWCCAGFMLVFGTQVLLDPIALMLYPYRPDLAVVVQVIHIGLSVVGYGLVLIGFLSRRLAMPLVPGVSFVPGQGERWQVRAL